MLCGSRNEETTREGNVKAVRSHSLRNLFVVLAVLGGLTAVSGQTNAPAGGPWKAHDMNRPRPPVRDPGPPGAQEFAPPPAGAVVLFDGRDLAQWERKPGAKAADQSPAPKWKIENGYMEIASKSGSIFTKEKFGDCRLHLEWATPAEVKGNGQGRGNSGVFLPGHQEVQVLDSYQNDTYPDGQAAAVYGKYPPSANVCRKPGEWQSYDITLEQPRYDAQRKLTAPCTLTVVHNGVVVQDRVDLGGGATNGVLSLQDHNNPVRYRNIWIQRLPAAGPTGR